MHSDKFLEPYTMVIAPCVHVSKHTPQSLHLSSITNETSSSLREIARAGHSPIQLPQLAQESALIFATMVFTPYLISKLILFIELYINMVESSV